MRVEEGTMRRIVMFNRVSADGYFATADGKLDWVVPEEEIDKAGASAIPGTDTILFGRRTFQMFERFWPQAVDGSPTAPRPHGEGRSAEMRAMGLFLNDSTKIVFSRTLKEATWKNSRLLHEFDPRQIEEIKQQPGKDIMIFGSGSIVSQLTEHGLIDEYQFVVSPILLGSGRLLLTNVSKTRTVRLREVTKYPSGNVMLSYARADD
jgi:dihydrofolate reductase